MLFSLIPLELKKYKRTVLPWMIAGGGLLTSGTAIIMVLTENRHADWETYAVTGLSFTNLLALLLVAVFTGFVFNGENSNNIDNILFTYPISRIRFFLSKNMVLLLFTVLLYLAFFIFTMLFGLVLIEGNPELKFCIKLLEISLILPAVNFILVPVTTLVTILFKGAGTFLFAGMAYFMLYISFINTDIGVYVPACQPDKLLYGFFSPGGMNGSDFITLLTVCTITFLSAIIISAAAYTRQDVSS